MALELSSKVKGGVTEHKVVNAYNDDGARSDERRQRNRNGGILYNSRTLHLTIDRQVTASLTWPGDRRCSDVVGQFLVH